MTRPGVLLAFDVGYDWQQARTSIVSLSYVAGFSSASTAVRGRWQRLLPHP
ncbi:MAG: hypothetical protein WKG07_27035 [Hymenobacter sp.]